MRERRRVMWLPVDAFARWMQRTLGYQQQLRIAVLLLWSTIPFYPLGFFLLWGMWFELVIWEMSNAALTYTALGVIAGLEAAKEASHEGGSR